MLHKNNTFDEIYYQFEVKRPGLLTSKLIEICNGYNDTIQQITNLIRAIIQNLVECFNLPDVSYTNPYSSYQKNNNMVEKFKLNMKIESDIQNIKIYMN